MLVSYTVIIKLYTYFINNSQDVKGGSREKGRLWNWHTMLPFIQKVS